MKMKMIKVKTCNECPFVHHDDGGGHCSGFINCSKFSIMLSDWDGPENFDIHRGIHPKCKLEDAPKLIKHLDHLGKINQNK
jgi:hypothetical protein